MSRNGTKAAKGRQQRGEHRLLEAFARLCRTYELVLHAASEGIFSLDSEGRISFANPAAGNILGWLVEDLAGLPVCEAVHGVAAHAGQPCPLLSQSRQEVGHRRDTFRHREGRELAVEYSLAPILEDEQVHGAVLMFTDISEREQGERVLQASLAALRESNERLALTRDQLVQAEKLAALGRIAAGIAHEINSPLGYIGANINSLRFDTENLIALVEAYRRVEAAPGDAQAAAALAAARQRCDFDYMRDDTPALLRETSDGLARMAGIVRELREYADAGGDGEWRPVDLAQLLEAAVAEAFAREDKTVRVEREYAQVPRVYCLEPVLRRAFAAVARNALQALSAGGVLSLRIREGEDDTVVVQIEDDGVGIAPEHLARVVDPFFTTRPVGSGIGMGLAVADSAVRRHGGHLRIARRTGGGTVVAVTLRLVPEGAQSVG